MKNDNIHPQEPTNTLECSTSGVSVAPFTQMYFSSEFDITMPEVSATFIKSVGRAANHDPLILEFTRSGPLDQSLSASFDLEGTAIPGISDGNGGAIPSDADYTCPTDHPFHRGVNPITFNAGQGKVDVTLTPTDGTPNTPDKTIEVTILPDPAPMAAHGDISEAVPHYTTPMTGPATGKVKETDIQITGPDDFFFNDTATTEIYTVDGL